MTSVTSPSLSRDQVADPSRRSASLIALALIGVCVAAEVAVLRIGVDDLDEGYFAQQAVRVLHGQVPFRDFATLYSPGLAYLHAWLFAVVGEPSLLAMRALAVVARAVLAGLLYVLARPLVRQPLWAAWPGVFLILALDDAPVRWEPHPGWLSTLLAVLATVFVSRRQSLAAGAAAALSYAFKQNTGLFILGAILVWDAYSQRRIPVATGLGFGAVTAAWLTPLVIANAGDVTRLSVLIGAVSQAGLFSPPEIGLLVPLACLVGGLWLVRSDTRIAWLLLAGTALLLNQYPRMDNLHLVWSAPLLLVVGAVVLDRLRAPLAILLALAAFAVAWPTMAERLEYLALPRAPLADLEVPASTATEMAALTADIRQNTSKGEPIFVYPTAPLVYVLAERPNPTRFDHLNPGAASAADIQQVLTDLDAANVQVVVVSDFWRTVWGPPGANAPLEAYIDAHFAPVARYGGYRLLTRAAYNAPLARMFAWTRDAGARH